MKELLISLLLVFSLILTIGCSSETSDAPKSTKCGEGKCGTEKKASKCGEGKYGGDK